MPLLPINKRKLLRRRLHVLMYLLAPEHGLHTREELERLIARASLESVAAVLREAEVVRSYGLPRTADLLALWWQSQPGSRSPTYARIPEAVAGAVSSDPALRAELLNFVVSRELLSRKLLRLLHESPEATAKLLSVRYRAAQEEAKRQIPGLIRQLTDLASLSLQYFDDAEIRALDAELKQVIEGLKRVIEDAKPGEGK